MVCNPNTLITFSDAGAHLRNMAFYNLPLRLLKLVQESHGEGRPIMPIEQAIHRLTGEQADWLGIDAGRIREGDRADIVVLDPRGLQQDLERENWDTMQGFDIPRMVCRNPGCVSHVLINGRLAVDDEQVVPELGQAQGFGRFLAAR
jgi:N-acyl-D-aspartate/D-glutamate deacylase